jgi:hypothetical protein
VGEDECIDACIRSSYSSLDPVIAFHFLALAPFRNFFSLAAATAVICGTRQEAEAAVAEEEEEEEKEAAAVEAAVAAAAAEAEAEAAAEATAEAIAEKGADRHSGKRSKQGRHAKRGKNKSHRTESGGSGGGGDNDSNANSSSNDLDRAARAAAAAGVGVGVGVGPPKLKLKHSSSAREALPSQRPLRTPSGSPPLRSLHRASSAPLPLPRASNPDTDPNTDPDADMAPLPPLLLGQDAAARDDFTKAVRDTLCRASLLEFDQRSER